MLSLQALQQQTTIMRERLGPYEILAPLGAGGMGEVYRARDRRLDRIVAIKVLSAATSLRPEARLRFEREARAVASLNHPHICALHDIGHDDGVDFLVMQYLEGETLASRLTRGALSISDAIRYGIDIAEAIDAAHRRGITHRDLKPSNIMLTKTGAVLLDFGLAKLRELPMPGSAATTDLTRDGVILGTVRYMAPEVLDGKEADARSDLFSFGAVVYEMVTGRRAFEGDSEARVISAIMAVDPPPMTSLRPDAPPALEAAVRTCLAKDPDDRWQDARDLVRQLQWIAESRPYPSSSVTPIPLAGSRVVVGRRWLAGAAIGGGVLALAVWSIQGARPWLVPEADRAEHGTMTALVTWPDMEENSRISPDGGWVSFLSNRGGEPRIWIRNLERGEPRQIAAPAGTITSHVWSPDSREIAYTIRAGDELFLQVIPAHVSGTPRIQIPLTRPATLIRWIGPHVYASWLGQESLYRVDLDSRSVIDLVTAWDPRLTFPRHFDVSADARRIVFAATREGQIDLWVANVDGRAATPLTQDAFADVYPIWGDAKGTSVFFQSDRGGQLDIWHLAIADGKLRQVTVSPEEEMPHDVAANGGILTYGQKTETAELWSLEAGGDRGHVYTDALRAFWPSLSRDGARIAFQRRKPTLGGGFPHFEAEIFVGRRDRGRIESALALGDGFFPRLSPDGRWLAYLASSRKGRAYTSLLAQDLVTQRNIHLTDRFQAAAFRESPFDWTAINVTWAPVGTDLYFVERLDSDVRQIRRFRAAEDDRVDTVVTGAKPGEVLRDLWLTPDGRRLAYVRYRDGVSVVQERDLTVGADRPLMVYPHQRSGSLLVKGWLPPEPCLVVLTGRPDRDATQHLEVQQVCPDRVPRTLGVVERGYAQTARLDAARRLLYLTTREGEAPNIVAWSLTDGTSRRVTDNALPAVTFSALEALPSGTLMWTRQELKYDIWTLRFSQTGR
jgi:serine/threonine protein kinase